MKLGSSSTYFIWQIANNGSLSVLKARGYFGDYYISVGKMCETLFNCFPRSIFWLHRDTMHF